jgi:PhoH-like ATPase
MHQIVEEKRYDKIIVMKPTVPVGGVDIGALPGDKFEKLSSWLGPIKDNIEQLAGSKNMSASLDFTELVQDGVIEVEAVSFIQGRSITNSVIILDECQNLSPQVTRNVVERCGKNSKVILLGDPSQVENTYLDKNSNGLIHAANGALNSEISSVISLKKVERSLISAEAQKIFGGISTGR